MTLELPNTGMAVIIDIGDAKDIHPKNKQDVGKRLALWALAKTYEKDVVYSGPLYKSMDEEGQADHPALRSRRRRAGGQGRRSRSRALPSPGRISKFVWADAKIEGDNDRGQQRQGRRAGGRALRLGGQPRLQPVQQGGPAGLAVPNGHLARRDCQQQVRLLGLRFGTRRSLQRSNQRSIDRKYLSQALAPAGDRDSLCIRLD